MHHIEDDYPTITLDESLLSAHPEMIFSGFLPSPFGSNPRPAIAPFPRVTNRPGNPLWGAVILRPTSVSGAAFFAPVLSPVNVPGR
jgi:hypothetical protein